MNKLKFPNPAYMEAVERGYSTWGIKPFIYNFRILSEDSMIIPRGVKNFLFRLAEEFHVKYFIQDNRAFFPPNFSIDSSAIQYRPYQNKAILELVNASTEGVLVAPPGSGKTVMGLSLVPLFGQPTLWITHTDRLAKQALERATVFLPSLTGNDVGYIGAGKWKPGNILTVAMVQTLNRKEEELQKISNSFGLVVLDEAHHCPAFTFTQVINKFAPRYLYGLTATPYRRDKLEQLMFQALGDAIVRIDMDEIAAQGSIIIPKVRYRAIESGHIDTNNINSIMKHYIIPNNKRNGIIVGDVLREALEGNFCLVMSNRKDHCEILHELISIHWKKTGIATGDYNKKYIDEQVAKFYSGEITVLVATFDLLGEGFDVDFLNRGFIAAPFRAEGRVEQLVGRFQRSAKGKKDAIIYDYVDVNVGVLKNQFYSPKEGKDCRYSCYERLGLHIEPY